MFDLIIANSQIIDGSGAEAIFADVAVNKDKVVAIGDLIDAQANIVIEASGLTLAPGFIDVHTHDDLEVIRNPDMLAKVSQGVATVVVGNCGISATPYEFDGAPPDPINLLGQQHEFTFPNLQDYVGYLEANAPNCNVVALVGHTALRAQVMNDLTRAASEQEIERMRELLVTALKQGAKGLSTGLAYKNAKASPSNECEVLASELKAFDALYTTHLRTEFDGIIGALDEAFALGRKVSSPVVISHIKCAGKNNWGRAWEIINHIEKAAKTQTLSCDVYPYNASSSTLDLKQVTDDFDIFITWSESEPEMAGQTLKAIAEQWGVTLLQAAERLMPAGAVYHGMDEGDVKQFLQMPRSMVGSDGLPCDPHPHPRLYGAFPRVLGRYARQQKLFSLEQAIHKMTALSAQNFKLEKRGLIKEGYFADLVLFDAEKVIDSATFSAPFKLAEGIEYLWVNGQLTYQQSNQGLQTDDTNRAGRFLAHEPNLNSKHKLR